MKQGISGSPTRARFRASYKVNGMSALHGPGLASASHLRIFLMARSMSVISYLSRLYVVSHSYGSRPSMVSPICGSRTLMVSLSYGFSRRDRRAGVAQDGVRVGRLYRQSLHDACLLPQVGQEQLDRNPPCGGIDVTARLACVHLKTLSIERAAFPIEIMVEAPARHDPLRSDAPHKHGL